ncbi:MAG TPA: DNA gyrase inhibitor YacG [Terriglobales bacterium]|jgi:endogenous inhibitor of DNA gyrase (YacG/DUF329 family)|nr:DNA gyrase inhibitor YacG [Terriglobales bacterium]
MTRKKVASLRCPTCSKIVLREEPDFPFCSDRCRLIDLGKWASGGYVISSPITDPEDIERVQKSQEGRHRDDDNHDRNIH